jgi:hypothetical protein
MPAGSLGRMVGSVLALAVLVSALYTASFGSAADDFGAYDNAGFDWTVSPAAMSVDNAPTITPDGTTDGFDWT